MKNICKNLIGFTLAEVLITLMIIGIVASLVIPPFTNYLADTQYRSAYKKAFSDFNQAFALPIANKTLTERTGSFDATATASEWAVLKSAFKITQDCTTAAQLYSCWANGDQVCTAPCGTGTPAIGNGSLSFIDSAGRSWAEYSMSENLYLVDTNGFKGPNQFGKDRWTFTFWDGAEARITSGLPVQIGVYNGDVVTAGTGWCTYPPCYYKSWLYGFN